MSKLNCKNITEQDLKDQIENLQTVFSAMFGLMIFLVLMAMVLFIGRILIKK